MRRFRGEEVIDGRLSLRLPGLRDWFVTSHGVLDWKASAFANREVKQSIDRLFGMTQDVSDRPALAVLNKIMTGCVQFGHNVFQSVGLGVLQNKSSSAPLRQTFYSSSCRHAYSPTTPREITGVWHSCDDTYSTSSGLSIPSGLET
jgi:hypothetical protein